MAAVADKPVETQGEEEEEAAAALAAAEAQAAEEAAAEAKEDEPAEAAEEAAAEAKEEEKEEDEEGEEEEEEDAKEEAKEEEEDDDDVEPAEKPDLEELPDLDMAKTGLPTVDALFATGEEALDMTTEVNNGIVKSVGELLAKLRKGSGMFGSDGASGDNKEEGAMGEIKSFIRIFIKVCKEMLSDISACLPQIDLGLIKEGKLKIIWPTFNFDKLSDELRPMAEKAWAWIKGMMTEIKDLVCDAFGKVPEIVKNFLAGCKGLSAMKLLGEAKKNCSSLSDAKKAGNAASENIKMAQANIVKFIKTLASNASQPLLAVMSGFKQALKEIQDQVFANAPKTSGRGLPNFSKADADAVDANAKMAELPPLGVNEVGISEVDSVFSGVKGLFDTLVDANNKIIAKAKEMPGAEDGSGLHDAIASAMYDGKDAMEDKPKTCFCLGGGPPMAQVDASWSKLKNGDIKLELPKFNLDKLSASARGAVEKLMELAQAAIQIIKQAFKAIPQKIKELTAAIKKLTPSKVKALAKKELENAAEIPHKLMMLKENVAIFDFIQQLVGCFFTTFTSIAKAIKEGFAAGAKALEAPKGKAPKQPEEGATAAAPDGVTMVV